MCFKNYFIFIKYNLIGDMMKKLDKTLFICVTFLCFFGLLMVYSSSSIWADYKFGDSFHYLKYQFIFFIIGFFLMIIVSKIDVSIYYSMLMYYY